MEFVELALRSLSATNNSQIGSAPRAIFVILDSAILFSKTHSDRLPQICYAVAMQITDVYNPSCSLCGLCNVGNKFICLPGKGDSKSRSLIVGEAPGAKEDDQGIPFVGISGDYINAALAKAGVRPEELYITNSVKCRPPGNRTPTNHEISACFPYLFEEVRLIDPVSVMTLGNPATYAVSGRKLGITQRAGLWERVARDNAEDLLVIPNYHPAYIARNPDKKDFFEEVVDEFVKVWQYGVKHTLEETWRYAKP
jgi:uracil-DNA glycosylase family 4